MADRSWAVRVPISMRLVNPPIPVRTLWRYDPAEPYAVHARLGGVDWVEWVEWVFARDLLAQGVAGPAGLGDVILWPRPGLLTLALSSDEGSTTLLGPIDRFRRFLAASYAWVPRGEESTFVDVDSCLARMVGGESR